MKIVYVNVIGVGESSIFWYVVCYLGKEKVYYI